MKFFDKSDPIKMSMKKAMGVFLPEDAEVIFASVENFNDVRDDLEKGTPVIFYGMESEASLRLGGNTSASWFYSKTAAYFQVPFLLVNMILMYEKIKKGEKLENKAVLLAAKSGYKQSLVGRLLHDIYPGKYGCEEGLKLAEKEYGFTGTIEEVREQLQKIQGKDVGKVYAIVGDEMLPGIFCDVEGTLISNDKKVTNEDILNLLVLFEEQEKKPVTLWTGGDIRELEKFLYLRGLWRFPVVSKEIFRGCRVEMAYDDLPREEFEKHYGIMAETFIKI